MQALTHRSMHSQNNERLEFLGDSIVNFVIAEALFHEQENAKEGELSRLRASLVKGETLAQLAREFNLGDYLLLGSGELKSGGMHRDSILADAMEAIIAAMYCDAGMELCKEKIKQWFTSRLKNISSLKTKDPKTRLQEYLQGRGYDLPDYEVLAIEGEAHAQQFTVSCKVDKLKLNTVGKGGSRRKAEQEAAENMLATLGDKA